MGAAISGQVLLDWRLPREKRRRVRTIAALLWELRQKVAGEAARSGGDVQRAVLELVPALENHHERLGVPRALLAEYLDGVQLDLVRDRYRDWTQLRQYCRALVGAPMEMVRLALGGDPALGRDGSLGEAWQIAGILWNLSDDLARGRVYLPEQDFLIHGARLEDLAAGRATPELLALVGVYTSRAADLFAKGRTHAAALPNDGSRAWALGWIARREAMLARLAERPEAVFAVEKKLTLGERMLPLTFRAGAPSASREK